MARICMPTARHFKTMVFQSSLYEAQDVLAEVADVDVVQLAATRRFRRFQPLQRKLLWHDFTDRLALVNPGLEPVRLSRPYDVLVHVCQNWWDLLHMNAIDDWRSRCATSICYMDELYSSDLSAYRHWLPALAQFDHVVLGMRGSLEAVQDALGRRCHYVPVGIDTLRFSPLPRPPDRTIDIYSIGRRWPRIHDALLDYAERTGALYVFDAMRGVANVSTNTHVEYRKMLAAMAKRSRLFVVAPAKLGIEAETGGQQELGYRFFEGAAAGTVMIGQAPDCLAFRQLFDWPDAVIRIEPDGSDASARVRELSNDADRLDSISRRNARESLLRHDWVYRWRDILAIAGVAPTAGMESRIAKLQELARTGP